MLDRNRGEKWFLAVVSGRGKGLVAAATRCVLCVAEPFYCSAMLVRNLLYSRRILKAAHADRPVISVGNLTTGGTGKTPMVIWLATQLRAAGRHPAVLLRGYKSGGAISDEETLLRLSLISPDGSVPVQAGANRFNASQSVRKEHPEVDVFVLDDGLQHRRLARHFDLALVDATAPFGFEHVIPRGLLREPIRALRRVNAVVITRWSLVEPAALAEVEARIRGEQPDVPIYHADFALDRLVDAQDQPEPVDALRGKRYFAFCGIGNPTSFFTQLDLLGGQRGGVVEFADHHAYTVDEIDAIVREAKTAGADYLLTTAKDWVKIKAVLFEARRAVPPLLFRVEQSVQFHGDGGERLVNLVVRAVEQGDSILGWRKSN